MRILALETTEKIGSVAAASDDNLLAELNLDQTQRSAQSLAPAMHALLKQVGWLPGDVQLVAVSSGPVRSPDLRVGRDQPPKSSPMPWAPKCSASTPWRPSPPPRPRRSPKCPAVIDAQRGDVAARRFVRRADGWFEPVDRETLVDAETWLNELPAGVVATGPVLGKLADRLPRDVRTLDSRYWPPRAAVVARLAARDYAARPPRRPLEACAHYCRRSAAEEKMQDSGGETQI